MPKTTAQGPRYGDQRPHRTPPHVSLGDLRSVARLTLDEVCQRVEEISGKPLTRGALSAIENGHRGASESLLSSLCAAYGLRDGAITTDYTPRLRSVV